MSDSARARSQALLPEVTICLPAYQAEAFINRTLSAIAVQSHTGFQCIISDDASVDRTLSICREFAARDNRFEVMANQKRLGWVGNVNRVLARVTGEYFMIASHDDVMGKEYLEELLAALQLTPTAVVAFSDMLDVRQDRPTLIKSYALLEGRTSPLLRAAGVITGLGIWWIPYRGVVRKSMLRDSPRLRYNRAGEFSADFPWILNLASAGQFVRVPKPLLAKHHKTDSVSSQWYFTPSDHAAVLMSCAQVIWKSGLSLPRRCLLLLLLPLRFAGKLAWDGCRWINNTFRDAFGLVRNEH